MPKLIDRAEAHSLDLKQRPHVARASDALANTRHVVLHRATLVQCQKLVAGQTVEVFIGTVRIELQFVVGKYLVEPAVYRLLSVDRVPEPSPHQQRIRDRLAAESREARNEAVEPAVVSR